VNDENVLIDYDYLEIEFARPVFG